MFWSCAHTAIAILTLLPLVSPTSLSSSSVDHQAKKVNSVLRYAVELTKDLKILDRFNIFFLGRPEGSLVRDLEWSQFDHVNVGRRLLITTDILQVVDAGKNVLKRFGKVFNLVLVCGPVTQVPDVPLWRRRNEHHFYMFHQVGPYEDNVLSKVFKLKFKVEVHILDPSAPPKITSMCFFCNSGYPMIVNVPQSNNISLVFPDYATHLNGTTLNVTATKGIHRAMDYETLPNGTVVFAGGYVHQIFFSLQRKFAFKYRFTLSKGFGHKGKNGTFSGVIGALQSGKFDYGMEAGSNSDRYQVVEYLPLVAYETLSFLTKIPTLEPKVELVFEPFQPETWIALFLTMLMLGGAFGTFALASSKIVEDSNMHIGRQFQMGLEFTVTTFVEQGYEGSLFKNGFQVLRILATAWLLSLIVLGTAYKAKLTTLMAYPALEVVPSTFDELANSDYNVFLHELGGLPELVFKTSTNPTLIDIRKRFQVQKSLHSCIDQTVKLRAACVALGFNSMFIASKNFSNVDGKVMIRKAPHTLLSFMHAAPLMKKGQPFAKHFARTVHTLNAMGLTSKFILDEEDKQLRKGKEWARQRAGAETWRLREPSGPQAIKLLEVLGVVIVYSVMVTICSILYIVENIHFKFKRSLSSTEDPNVAKTLKIPILLSVFRPRPKQYSKEHDFGNTETGEVRKQAEGSTEATIVEK